MYEILDANGQVVKGPTTVGAGSAVDHIDDIEVPGPGEYRLRVRLRDAAGNESGWVNYHIAIRLDRCLATNRAERANGWIAAHEFPYVQRWRPSVGD